MWDLPEKKINQRFFKLDQNLKEKFYTQFGVDSKSIERTVGELKQWASEQPELPKESRDSEFLENVYALSKFREDVTKVMISGYFKSLLEYPQVFKNVHNYGQDHFDDCCSILLEKLTNNAERVVILKIYRETVERFNFNNLFLIGFPLYLLNSHFAGPTPIRIIFDFDGINFQHYKTIDLGMLIKLTSIYKNGLKHRITGFDYLNAPPTIERFSSMLRFLLSPKLTQRIFIHENLEDLHKYVPKEILPKEYGGPQYTCEEMKNTSNLLIKENKDFFDKIISMVPKNADFDSVFGAEGSFRTLSLD